MDGEIGSWTRSGSLQGGEGVKWRQHGCELGEGCVCGMEVSVGSGDEGGGALEGRGCSRIHGIEHGIPVVTGMEAKQFHTGGPGLARQSHGPRQGTRWCRS
jgi:hypothetical protein